ncbi:MAG: glycosyltransferase [Pirellulales bacterium]|nr:glycosyltransferase [Pirellulales bacterium]
MHILPRVSVIMPCFNQGQYVDDAINSVINQSFKDIEIVLIEDCSTDNFTREYVRQKNFPNTKKIINSNNLGVSASRNKAIQAARGIFILPLDADDMIRSDFISAAIDVIDKDIADVVYSKVEFFGDRKGPFKLPEFSLRKMLQCNAVVNTALFRKSAWASVSGYSSEMKAGVEDWDFWLSLIESGQRFHRINRSLFCYRQHGVSRTTTAVTQVRELHELIFKRHKNLYWEQGIHSLNDLLPHDKECQTMASKRLSKNIRSIKKRIPLLNKAKSYPSKKPISLYYCNPKKQHNFGDQLTIDLVMCLTGQPVRCASTEEATHVGIGSPLEQFLQRKSSPRSFGKPLSVWGTGFIASEGQHPHLKEDITGRFIRPLQLNAVRGLLTLERLREMGLDISKAAIGDPGLLAKLLVPKKTVRKKYQLGLIPHYVDKKEPIFSLLQKRFKPSKLICVEQKPTSFLADLQQCDVIISSAMHGLTAADSLGIPNIRTKVSDRITGGDYEFLDYYSAFNLAPRTLTLEDLFALTEHDLANIHSDYAVDNRAVDRIISNLLSSCPLLNLDQPTALTSQEAA